MTEKHGGVLQVLQMTGNHREQLQVIKTTRN